MKYGHEHGTWIRHDTETETQQILEKQNMGHEGINVCLFMHMFLCFAYQNS